jgi:type I restriction enzyme, S subunit
MVSVWPTLPLSDVTDIRTGKLDSNAAVPGGQYPYFTCSPETLAIDRFEFDCHAVILAGNNANGIFCVKTYAGKFNAYQRTYVITSKKAERLDVGFLYYFIKTVASHLTAFSAGTATKFLTRTILDPLPVPVPHITTQRRIGSLLGALDDKINLNRRMSETLEAMARAIFKDWFVDFGPTRAKMRGCVPYLTPEVWSLFPDRLDGDGKPEGWEYGALGSQVSVTKGRSYKSDELRDSTTALVTLKSFERGGGYRPDGLKAFTGTYKPEQVVVEGDLIVAQTDVTQAAEVIGQPARVVTDSRFSILVASLDVAVIRPCADGILGKHFLYCLMRSEDFRQHTYSHSTGTTVLHLSKQAIPSFTFPMASREVLNPFEKAVSSLFSRAIHSLRECSTLTEIRDLLLPKLMSGEIRIKEAEKAVAELV